MSNEKKYPVHHTDHDNFPDVGAVYVTRAEFDAMKSERDALQKLVEELKEAQRWRKFSEEKPSEEKYWMPLPKAPEAVA